MSAGVAVLRFVGCKCVYRRLFATDQNEIFCHLQGFLDSRLGEQTTRLDFIIYLPTQFTHDGCALKAEYMGQFKQTLTVIHATRVRKV